MSGATLMIRDSKSNFNQKTNITFLVSGLFLGRKSNKQICYVGRAQNAQNEVFQTFALKMVVKGALLSDVYNHIRLINTKIIFNIDHNLLYRLFSHQIWLIRPRGKEESLGGCNPLTGSISLFYFSWSGIQLYRITRIRCPLYPATQREKRRENVNTRLYFFTVKEEFWQQVKINPFIVFPIHCKLLMVTVAVWSYCSASIVHQRLRNDLGNPSGEVVWCMRCGVMGETHLQTNSSKCHRKV